MYKTIFTIGMIASVLFSKNTVANQNVNQTISSTVYPDTLIITEAYHEDDFSGYMIAERISDFKVKYLIDEDPEDLDVGDIISVIMDTNGTDEIMDDIVLQYRYTD